VSNRELLLSQSVEAAVNGYLETLNGESACDLYCLVLAEVERPLLGCVMAYVGGNQSRAAAMLGMNRATLRKKLKGYGII
jgi:Fis family transcriptional regulator